MKRKLEKLIKDPARVKDMHMLQKRILLLSKRSVEKVYIREAWRVKLEEELVETINKFVGQIKSIKKEETHEVHRSTKR